jgi:hypothetical protein
MLSGRRPGWNDAEDPLARARIHVVCLGRSGERITGYQQISRSSAKVPTCVVFNSDTHVR